MQLPAPPVRLLAALLTLFTLGIAAPAGWAQSFRGLGHAIGLSTQAYDLSANGLTIAGSTENQAFHWMQGEGQWMTGLGFLPGGDSSSRAFGISADASTIVGWSDSASGRQAYRWTQTGGMIGLGDLAGGLFNSEAYGISGDGTVIVGQGFSASGREAFRWTQAGGIIGLSDLPGGSFESWAGSVSADGSIIAGTGNSISGYEAFRWTQAGGMVGLGDLPGGGFTSQALSISPDGNTIVGYGETSSGLEAFRWTQADGMIGLGDLAGGTFDSAALAVSADGGTIVGRGENGNTLAFIWDSVNGMRNLQTVLTNDYGLDLSGWTLHAATAISVDGNTIAGFGTYGSRTEAFIATIPEPSTALLLGGAGLGLLLRRRR